MSGAFTDQILAEKLFKLNQSQASIESLSHWCIFHRRRASQIVQRWEKEVKSAASEKIVALLYLANDIIQNSRRKGTEFLNEFGKSLPLVLKDCHAKDDKLRAVVLRLVRIWEERRVFGTQEKPLLDLFLNGSLPLKSVSPLEKAVDEPGTIPSPPNPVTLPGPLQKIALSYAAVQDCAVEEDVSLRKCNAAIMDLQLFEKNIPLRTSTAPALSSELDSRNKSVSALISQLEMCEKKRHALVNLLKEALQTQESKLERVRSQLRAAKDHSLHVVSLKQQLLSTGSLPSLLSSFESSMEGGSLAQMIDRSGATGSAALQGVRGVGPGQQPQVSAGPSVESLHSRGQPAPEGPDEAKRNEAAELAAKLASSTSSAAMLSSVLSSLAAEGKLPAGLGQLADPRGEKRRRADEPPPQAETRFSFPFPPHATLGSPGSAPPQPTAPPPAPFFVPGAAGSALPPPHLQGGQTGPPPGHLLGASPNMGPGFGGGPM